MRSIDGFGRAALRRSLVDEHGDRHAPGALAREHPVGAVLDHAAQRVLAAVRHEARLVDGVERLARSCRQPLDVAVHGDEPLRRVAEDDRLLGAPGMRDSRASGGRAQTGCRLDQRLDDRLVGVALLALVGDDASTFKTRRIRGEGTVGADREGDGCSRCQALQLRRVLQSRFQNRPAMTGGCMHEAGAGFVGHMVARNIGTLN